LLVQEERILVDHHLAVVVEGDGQKNEESLKIDERHNNPFPRGFLWWKRLLCGAGGVCTA